MQIKTDYEIGSHIWYVHKNQGEVCVYDAYIVEITINKDGIYYTIDEGYETVKENDVILYGDMDKLYMKIDKLMSEIREEESSEQDG